MNGIYKGKNKEWIKGFVNGINIARYYNDEELFKVTDKLLTELENE